MLGTRFIILKLTLIPCILLYASSIKRNLSCHLLTHYINHLQFLLILAVPWKYKKPSWWKFSMRNVKESLNTSCVALYLQTYKTQAHLESDWLLTWQLLQHKTLLGRFVLYDHINEKDKQQLQKIQHNIHAKFSLHLRIGFNTLHSNKAAHKTTSHFNEELQ